jgi:hypothetical protein
MNARQAQLFARYVEELRSAKEYADLWWDGLIEAEARTTGDREEAVERVQGRWRVGPVAHPRVIAVLRKYYFECKRLNEEVSGEEPETERDEAHSLPGEEDYDDEDEDDDDEDEDDDDGDGEVINPSVFLGEFLVGPETEDLADFVGKLTYWPIGMDFEGNLV